MRIVLEVVNAEGPVHEDRVLRGLLAAWGTKRAGARVKSAFDRAVRKLSAGQLRRSPKGFLSVSGRDAETVRVPTADEASQRPIRHVPPNERQRALLLTVRDAHSIDQDDLRLSVARLFGWRRTGAEISATLDDDIEDMVESGQLARSGSLLRERTAPPS